jgi:hypothetical protein
MSYKIIEQFIPNGDDSFYGGFQVAKKIKLTYETYCVISNSCSSNFCIVLV